MPDKRTIFEETLSGARERPWIPPLRRDNHASSNLPKSLAEFRAQEGPENRNSRLHALWKSICKRGYSHQPSRPGPRSVAVEQAERLRAAYEDDLFKHFGGHLSGPHPVSWKEFKKYAEEKEVELWSVFHDELDLDGNGHLDMQELDVALRKAGIALSPSTLDDLMVFLTSSSHSHAISFTEFRDFLLLLPRKVSAAEIYQYYEMKRFLGDDGKGAARVTMEGDVSLSAEDKPPDHTHFDLPTPQEIVGQDEDFLEDEEVETHSWMEGHTALKFLLAGGIAGAVSRTCTAPFDRIKVFLITRSLEVVSSTSAQSNSAIARSVRVIAVSVAQIYTEGGVVAFWTGNGLNVVKIFPESAIKFYTYESTKRFFARYVEKVNDPRDISGTSRFISGGVAGIVSQAFAFPIETLKTQMMSNAGEPKRTLIEAIRRVWSLGGVKAYYRGLSIGLLGVFPYSAIDMSTFEALKLAYLRSTGAREPNAEPPILALLAFGSLSGSVGATSVYPLNLVRTRLQASGSTGHPTRYTGAWDVCQRVLATEGWRGFYRGLVPTLAKVVPAVSISYVVYEQSKQRLGLA